MVSAARKHFNAVDTEEFTADLDRISGKMRIFRGQEKSPWPPSGRIPAQTAKQVMIQRFREDERTSIYNEFIDRVGELTTGMAQRYEGGALVVSLGRAEGFMPRSEQIPGEQHQPGERVRCLILDVRDVGSQVKIVLSRAQPEFIKRLFEVEVPEVAERIIEVKAMAREPGHRTKIAVSSIDSKVDPVGACVGVRGSRIKNIVDELGGEKIDIVRWNESSQILIQNALRPAEVVEISLCFELGRATVVVNEDQLSLAIGKKGQNVASGRPIDAVGHRHPHAPEFTRAWTSWRRRSRRSPGSAKSRSTGWRHWASSASSTSRKSGRLHGRIAGLLAGRGPGDGQGRIGKSTRRGGGSGREKIEAERRSREQALAPPDRIWHPAGRMRQPAGRRRPSAGPGPRKFDRRRQHCGFARSCDRRTPGADQAGFGTEAPGQRIRGGGDTTP